MDVCVVDVGADGAVQPRRRGRLLRRPRARLRRRWRSGPTRRGLTARRARDRGRPAQRAGVRRMSGPCCASTSMPSRRTSRSSAREVAPAAAHARRQGRRVRPWARADRPARMGGGRALVRRVRRPTEASVRASARRRRRGSSSWLAVGRTTRSQRRSRPTSISGSATPASSKTSRAVRAARPARRAVHLKIDTGLHRNGIRPEEWPAVLERAARARARGRGRASWACGATSPRRATREDDDARALFDDAVTAAEAAGLTLEVRHLAASAASFARPEFRYDLVRVGAFCYGSDQPAGPARPTSASARSPLSALR